MGIAHVTVQSGYIELVDYMGNDYRILEAARVSTGAQAKKGESKDRNLIRYLYKNKHLSPFEMAVFTFRVKAPIFVARQWFRHRMGSFNEASARYKEFEWEPLRPKIYRVQDTKNKQNSSGMLIADDHNSATDLVENAYTEAEISYGKLLHLGVAREQARIVMPVGQYTEFMWTVNLRSLLHFLELRLHPHAQKEIRDYADAILSILHSLENEFKWTLEIFQEGMLLQYAIQDALQNNDYREVIKKLQ